MNIELITIGNEVLSGHTINSNAAFIGRELFQEGYRLFRESTILDDENEISEQLLASLERSDVVITTGGLGPTLDDISGHVAEKTLKSTPELIPNHLGSAPGLMFHQGSHILVMLPGVPHEMKKMFLDSVLPYIKKNYPLKIRPYRQILSLTRLFELTVDPILRELKEKYPALEFGIYPALGLLQIHIYAFVDNEEKAQEMIQPALQVLKERFAANVYEGGSIQEAIHSLFIEKGWTLSGAESVTGGSIAAHLTQLSGASKYFLGSVVSYSNESKINILGVSPKTIEQHGAVSEEVATEMVLGANRIYNSEFSFAVTGVAGPTGGTEEKPIGTVWFAVHRLGKEPKAWKVQGRGNREMIITFSMNEILGKLYHYAKNEN
jgi:nicotinamide-nucleotide amidase